MRLNILYDAQIFALQKYGGISRYFFELIHNLIPFEDIFLHDGINSNEYGVSSLVGCKKRWGYYIENMKAKRRFVARLNALHFKYFTWREDIDIYHPTYYEDYHVPGAKKVVTVYDMVHELFPEEFSDDPTTLKKSKILQNATGVIAISESTKRDLMNLFHIPAEKIRVVYLANSLFELEQEAPLMKDPYILYVGNRSGYKNFLGLANAYASSQYKNNLRLVCFGGGPFNEAEKAVLVKLGIWESVVPYSGDDAVLSNLYQFAEIFVYPSLYEGFGLPLLEAMHYGTAVLTGNTSSIPEVAGDAAEYFDPYDPESICNAMDQLLSDTVRRRELKCKGREREKLFSWKRCAEETLDFYRTLQ